MSSDLSAGPGGRVSTVMSAEARKGGVSTVDDIRVRRVCGLPESADGPLTPLTAIKGLSLGRAGPMVPCRPARFPGH